MPSARVQGGDLGQGQRPPGAADKGSVEHRAVHGQVVGQDQPVIGGQRHVELEGVDAEGERVRQSRQGVLRPERSRATMSVYLGHARTVSNLYACDVGERGRLRTIVMLLVFDVGGPLVTYALLRSVVGLSTVLSLVLSGILPAVGVVITALQFRKLDVFGVMVLAGIAMGSILGLTTHNARLYLAEGSVPSVVFSVACLASLRTREPLIYRIAIEFVGPDTKRGREITDAWPSPVFKRAFRIITVAWGVGYLIEAALRLVVAETTSTGIALVCSKVMPYVFAVVLATWTLVYGERRRKASTTVCSDQKTSIANP
jgi:hypothetical protein